MKIYLTRVSAAISFLILCLSVGGCSSVGDVQDPVVRRLTWFSFLSGDDLKTTCSKSDDHIRLVFNGNYKKDMRVIEIMTTAQGTSVLHEQLFEPIDWTDITINLDGTERPWSPTITQQKWSKGETNKFMTALGGDGSFIPLQNDVQLDSRGFFWVITGCHTGKWFFKAWAYPQKAYESLTFPEILEEQLASHKVFPAAEAYDDAYPPNNRDETPFFSTSANARGVKGRMLLPQPPFKTFLP